MGTLGQLYLHDAYLRTFAARVTAIREGTQVTLDQTAFYPTGGGQPHDTGTLSELRVVAVRKEGDEVWHMLDGPVPDVGEEVEGTIDWNRRHSLMRTHTALHVLCGVIWNQWGVPVTGGNMEPLSARMDFEFDPLPDGFGRTVEELVNVELVAARPVEVAWVARDEAFGDADLIRTKINLLPEGVDPIRVIDIVGLDKQADGGLHVRSTDEVGSVKILKTESKGKANKRVRLAILDP